MLRMVMMIKVITVMMMKGLPDVVTLLLKTLAIIEIRGVQRALLYQALLECE